MTRAAQYRIERSGATLILHWVVGIQDCAVVIPKAREQEAKLIQERCNKGEPSHEDFSSLRSTCKQHERDLLRADRRKSTAFTDVKESMLISAATVKGQAQAQAQEPNRGIVRDDSTESGGDERVGQLSDMIPREDDNFELQNDVEMAPPPIPILLEATQPTSTYSPSPDRNPVEGDNFELQNDAEIAPLPMATPPHVQTILKAIQWSVAFPIVSDESPVNDTLSLQQIVEMDPPPMSTLLHAQTLLKAMQWSIACPILSDRKSLDDKPSPPHAAEMSHLSMSAPRQFSILPYPVPHSMFVDTDFWDQLTNLNNFKFHAAKLRVKMLLNSQRWARPWQSAESADCSMPLSQSSLGAEDKYTAKNPLQSIAEMCTYVSAPSSGECLLSNC